MNTAIDRLQSWSELLRAVKVVEETHTFDLLGYCDDQSRYGRSYGQSCRGIAEVICQYLLVGDRKIPSTELPKVTIYASFWQNDYVAHHGDKRVELIRIADDGELIQLVVRYHFLNERKHLALVTDLPTT